MLQSLSLGIIIQQFIFEETNELEFDFSGVKILSSLRK